MIGTLVRYHLRWLTRSRDILATVLLTAGTVGLAGLLALHDVPQRAMGAAATIWLVASVGGLLATARVLAAEEGTGGLRGVLLAPVERRDLFLARALSSSVVVLGLVLAVSVVIWAMFPDLPGWTDPRLALVALVGSFTLGPLGALAAWAALSTRAGELMGPVVSLPMAAPAIVTGLHATERLLDASGGWEASLTFATGYALAVGALSYLVSEHVTEVA